MNLIRVDANGRRLPPRLPLASYFVNARLSESEALQVEIEVLKRARQRIAVKARTETDAGERFRYFNDPQHRIKVNQKILADVLVEFGFSRSELLEIDRGTKLGLVEEGPQKTCATVVDHRGVERTFHVEELEDRRPDGRHLARLTDVETGEVEVG